MRFLTIIGILFIFSAPLLATQVPHIDSIFIDELNGKLNIRGEFGVSKGVVLVNDVQMLIQIWTDSLIQTTIADTGKAMAGNVIVGTNGYQSNTKTISEWNEQVFFEQQVSYQSDGTTQTSGDDFYLSWRGDLESSLVGGAKIVSFSGMKISHRISTSSFQNSSKPFDTTVNYYHTNDSPFRYTVQFSQLENKFVIADISESIVDGEHINNFTCFVDTSFNIFSGHNDGQFTLGYYRFEWIAAACRFPPLRSSSSVAVITTEKIAVICHPNPFSQSTTISIQSAEGLPTHIDVYDVLGRKMGELFNSDFPSSALELKFEPAMLSAGAYFIRVQSGSEVVTKKIQLVK